MADTHDRKPTGAGKSSVGLIDVDTCFKELDLPEGICFLDVACGRGAYCLKAAQIVGSTGTVFGVDLWADGIEELAHALVLVGGTTENGRNLVLQRSLADGPPEELGRDVLTLEVEVRGNERIRHLVDGRPVLEYTRPQLDDGTPLSEGTISLQAESHPVEFRKVEMMPLAD